MANDVVYRVHGYSGLWRIVRNGTENVRVKPVDGGTSVKVPIKDLTPAGKIHEQPITVQSGFHILKDHWTDFPGITRYCNDLVSNLQAGIEATQKKAPRRTRDHGFQTSLRYSAPRPENIPERQLEWDLFTAFRPDAPAHADCHGLWEHLVTFQLPLYDDAVKDGWGHCDLIGINRNLAPVVIELKQENATDSPLRSVLEAAEYAIALRKVWGKVRDELHDTFARNSISIDLEDSLSSEIQIVVLAPDKHWDYVTASIGEEATHGLESLFAALREYGMVVSFGQIRQTVSADLDIQRFRFSNGAS